MTVTRRSRGLPGNTVVVLSAALAWAPACGGHGSPENAPPLAWESAHFRFAAWPDDGEVCTDARDVLEEHWAFWHTRLGLPDPTGTAIIYLKFRDENELWADRQCAPGAGGCTSGTTVRSYLLFDKHELIHAYLGETMLPPPALFAEGAAVAFSCDAGGFGDSSATPPWRAVLQPAPDSPVAEQVYLLGGQLVSYLVKRFGASAFVEFYGKIADASDPDFVADTFRATFGVALDDVWPEATASGRVDCLRLWECTRPLISLDGMPQFGRLVCGVDLVPRTLIIASDLNLSAAIRHAPVTMGLSAGCEDSAASGALSLFPGGDLNLLAKLPAGTYVVSIGGAEMTAAPVEPSAIGSNCASLVPYPVPADGVPLVVAGPGQPSPVFTRLHFDQPRAATLTGSVDEFTEPTTIWNCPDCSGDVATCPRADGSVNLRSVFNGDVTWTMQTSASWTWARIRDQ